MNNVPEGFEPVKTSEVDIIRNKKAGIVYVANFPGGSGKYISVSEHGSDDTPDIDIKISSRVQLRITYLTSSEKISGVEIAKLNGNKLERLHFSTLDFERILQLLSLFSELDLKAIANKTVVLDESIIGNPSEMTSFLKLIAADPEGRTKLKEVAINCGLIDVGDIDVLAQRKEAVKLFEKILNSPSDFDGYKTQLGVGKNEEVWQRFFSNNSWILGSDFIEILEERAVDVSHVVDYLCKSADGYLDIIELKLPEAPTWTADQVPRSDLSAAIMQCNRYIIQTEKRMNDVEFLKRIGYTPIIKPRVTLVYGRSKDWGDNENEAFRVLNASFHSITITTYDQLLDGARRVINATVT